MEKKLIVIIIILLSFKSETNCQNFEDWKNLPRDFAFEILLDSNELIKTEDLINIDSAKLNNSALIISEFNGSNFEIPKLLDKLNNIHKIQFFSELHHFKKIHFNIPNSVEYLEFFGDYRFSCKLLKNSSLKSFVSIYNYKAVNLNYLFKNKNNLIELCLYSKFINLKNIEEYRNLKKIFLTFEKTKSFNWNCLLANSRDVLYIESNNLPKINVYKFDSLSIIKEFSIRSNILLENVHLLLECYNLVIQRMTLCLEKEEVFDKQDLKEILYFFKKRNEFEEADIIYYKMPALIIDSQVKLLKEKLINLDINHLKNSNQIQITKKRSFKTSGPPR